MTENTKLHPTPPTAQTGEDYSMEEGDDIQGWTERAREAYQFSTTYIDQNYRKQWEDSIRAFNSQHPSDSKFVQEAYQKRSHIFRPKIRTVQQFGTRHRTTTRTPDRVLTGPSNMKGST